MKKLFAILLLLPLLASASVEDFWRDRGALSNAVFAMSSPFTANAYFVDAASGSDTNSGKAFAPWATISNACAQADRDSTIYVASGTYADPINRGNISFVFQADAGIACASSPIQAGITVGETNLAVYGGFFTNTSGASANVTACSIEPAGRLTLVGCRLDGQTSASYNVDSGEFPDNVGITHLLARQSAFRERLVFSNQGGDSVDNTRGAFEFYDCKFKSGMVWSGWSATNGNANLVLSGCVSAVVDSGAPPMIYTGTNLINLRLIFPE